MYFSYSKENLREINLIFKNPLVLKVFSFEFPCYICSFNDHIEIMLCLGQRRTPRCFITSRGKISINKGGGFSVIIMRR